MLRLNLNLLQIKILKQPKPDQNNTPTTGQDGNQTGQGTQVKPNNNQTTTVTDNQNAQQGNTGDTDKDAKVNTNDDETKQMLKMILNYLKQD